MKRYIVAGAIVMTSYGLTAMDPVTSHTLEPTPSLVVGIPTISPSETADEIDKYHKVYETNSEPEKQVYDEKWTPSEKHRRAEKLLAAGIFGECRGQSIYCMTAVGNVMMNRARLGLDKRYGRGLWGVLKKNKQFSCFNKNDPNLKIIKLAMSDKLKVGTSDFYKWKMAKDVAHILMHRSEADPTLGATHYHASYMIAPWVNDIGMTRTVKLDGHIFYKLHR